MAHQSRRPVEVLSQTEEHSEIKKAGIHQRTNNTYSVGEMPLTSFQLLKGTPNSCYLAIHNILLPYGTSRGYGLQGGGGKCIKMQNLAFLIGRHLEWTEDDTNIQVRELATTKFWVRSGTIINAGNDAILVKLDDEDREQALHCYTLAHAALEKCIKAVMQRCAVGPSSKALLNDDTPHELYIHRDPRTNEVRYVGISKDAKKRYAQHMRGKSDSPRKDAWINELKQLGLQPILIIIGRTQNKFQALIQEEYWIHYYIGQGMDLTNNENTSEVL
jgi:hypothetical protein